MPVIAPWLRPTNVLEAMSGGGHLGLSARQADQRDDEMQMHAELAAQREQQNAQEAAARLRYSYDALEQARQNSVRDDDFRKEDRDAARLLKRQEDDALAIYRTGMLKNQEDRNTYLKGKPTEPKTYHVGDHLVQVDPVGGVKTLFSNMQAEKIPTVSGVPLDPLDPTLGKISALANNPILNKLMGTNANTLGTNYVAPMPKLAPRAMVPKEQPEPDGVISADEFVDNLADAAEKAKVLDKETAAAFLKQAKGDKQKARQLAKEAGYSF